MKIQTRQYIKTVAATVWRCNGLLHRQDGPAYVDPTVTQWFREGRYHREGGPAIQYWSGEKYYYVNGMFCP